MKHKFSVTIALVLFYFLSQAIGLGIVYQDIKVEKALVNGTEIIEVTHPETAIGPRPEYRNMDAVFLVLTSVLIGTGLILAIIKLKKAILWKGLFVFAIFFSVTISLGVFFEPATSAALAAIMVFVKLKKPNVFIHNLSEILVYSGIAVLFVPLFEPIWIIVLLAVISVYDMFAVWKSKHMVKLAEFQTESKMFSGLSIPYKSTLSFKKKGYSIVSPFARCTRHLCISKEQAEMQTQRNNLQDKKIKTETTTAILGGGDVAFPLIFSGVVMESLIRAGVIGFGAFLETLIIPVLTAACLLGLLAYGKKGRYYPAMPFLTAGCLVGYFLVAII